MCEAELLVCVCVCELSQTQIGQISNNKEMEKETLWTAAPRLAHFDRKRTLYALFLPDMLPLINLLLGCFGL